jgi:hypothetical protein
LNHYSKRYDVKIIPDYLLTVDENHRWILDAKAPKEDIRQGRNPEQAFSYAIHPDIRANIYALCNGRELTVFDISHSQPILIFEIKDIKRKFEEIAKVLSPLAFTKPYIFNFKPDLGLYSLKLFNNQDLLQIFTSVGLRFLAKIEDNRYTLVVGSDFGEETYTVSFDFDQLLYQQLLSLLSVEQSTRISQALSRQPFYIKIDEDVPFVGINAKLSNRVYSNENEDYCPFIVEKFQKGIMS